VESVPRRWIEERQVQKVGLLRVLARQVGLLRALARQVGLLAALGWRVGLLPLRALGWRVGLLLGALAEPRAAEAGEPGCKLFQGQSVLGSSQGYDSP
jgi:hypothetical protein